MTRLLEALWTGARDRAGEQRRLDEIAISQRGTIAHNLSFAMIGGGDSPIREAKVKQGRQHEG